MYSRKKELATTWLDKCVRSSFQQNRPIANMLKDPKYC